MLNISTGKIDRAQKVVVYGCEGIGKTSLAAQFPDPGSGLTAEIRLRGGGEQRVPEIERRERWAERLMPSTYEFREAVLDTPNLVGVFTGHKHKLMVGQAGRALFFSVLVGLLSGKLDDAPFVSLFGDEPHWKGGPSAHCLI